MRKFFVWIFGFPTLLAGPAWQILRGLSDIDFVVQRANDPGWLGVVINALLGPGQWQSLAITALLIVVGLTVLYVALRRSEAPVFTSPLAKRAEANGRHLAELRHANRAGQARPQTEKKLHNLLGTLVIGFVIIAAIIGVVWVFREPTQILSADITVKSGPVFHVSGESPIEAYIYVQNDGKSDADIVRWRFGIAVVDAALGDRVTEYAELGSMELEKRHSVSAPKRLPSGDPKRSNPARK